VFRVEVPGARRPSREGIGYGCIVRLHDRERIAVEPEQDPDAAIVLDEEGAMRLRDALSDFIGDRTPRR